MCRYMSLQFCILERLVSFLCWSPPFPYSIGTQFIKFKFIFQVLLNCFDAGLKVSATVCDMDGVNKRALGILGANVQQPIISVGGQEVVTLFDTPHLLKCFRNLFLKHNIEYQTNVTSDGKTGIGKQFY